MTEDDVRRSRGGDGDHHSDAENVERPTLKEQELSGRRKPALVRSKTFDHSLLTQVQTDPDSKIERKKSHYSQLSKSNCQYHKLFKEISKEEQLRQSYTCALQKDILYQGRMFVSDHWICFHSKVFGKDTKIAIPVMSVTHIKKTKTAILLPNALVIATANDRYVFVSFMSRDNTYKFLMSISLHLEEKSPCSSPVLSSAPNSFRGQRSPLTPRFPRSFPGAFCDLDVAVMPRRRDLEESSSSDSQTPDDDKMEEFPAPPLLHTLKQPDGAAPPGHPDLQHKGKNQHQKQNQNQHQNQNLHQNQDNKQQDKRHAGSELIIDGRTLTVVSLNTLLFVYLLLVCVLVLSSCYLAFKIVSLEQRLTTLGSVADFPDQENDFLRGSGVNAELFSELLTINLMKLEKVSFHSKTPELVPIDIPKYPQSCWSIPVVPQIGVQKNLQRLLDEAT
ncbi:GRAM domain-containing protein 2B isoform X2 [Cyclopterus lumpus]|uniref:GRAM domain-containing protein 2B isoform X2 n=1 Tax=Cyclopterus lumpus TaxID=8103 RepID=UPI0014863375|nr:GRAM domain-containing protein 2B isoform X2 [Cyclopterus lumpus]